MKGYMEEKLLNLKLFSDEAAETDSAGAMGDGDCTDRDTRDIGPAETDKTPCDTDLAEDDTMHSDSDDKGSDADVSDENVTEPANSATASDEERKNEDAFLFYERIISEANRLSEKVDGFDLRKELADRSFIAILKCGLSVETAYNAVHFDELIAAAVQNAREEAWREMLAKAKLGEMRPTENGAASGAAVQSRAGVENLTGRGIREILRRVENGAKVKF